MTVSKPSSETLLAARAAIQRSPVLQQFFQRARKESWPSDYFASILANALDSAIEGSMQDLREAARYLADEYMQFGDGMRIVSRQTGRLVYKVTEEDLWQPPSTTREDGTIVTPSPRLRPELHGALIQWSFDETRDAENLGELQKTLPTTEYLKEHGDGRLRSVTRSGRQTIADELRQDLPRLLLEFTSGKNARFLQCFDFSTKDPGYASGLVPLPRRVAVAFGQIGVQDPKAMNLRFNHKTSSMWRIPSQWIAEMARNLSLEAQHHEALSVELFDVACKRFDGKFCIMSPSEHEALGDEFHRRQLGGVMLPVEGARMTLLRPHVGTLVVHPDGYELRSREVHDRWEIIAMCQYTLWVDWHKIEAYDVRDIHAITQLV